MTSLIKENVSVLGNVDITTKSGNDNIITVNVHNSSTIDLCRFLRSAMCGKAVMDQLPGKIIPCRADNEAEETKNIGLIPLLGQGIEASIPVEDNNDPNISYITIPFLIPNTMLSAGSSIRGFKLFSYRDEEYATIKLAKSQEIVVDQNTNIEIEWKLIIRPVID